MKIYLASQLKPARLSQVLQIVDSKNEGYVLNARDVRGLYTKNLAPVNKYS